MDKRVKTLSERSLEAIKRAVDALNRQPPRSISAPPTFDGDSPDVYIAAIPVTGIAAVASGVMSSASCSIYRVLSAGDVELIGHSETVFNPFDVEATAGFAVAARDKFGTWVLLSKPNDGLIHFGAHCTLSADGNVYINSQRNVAAVFKTGTGTFQVLLDYDFGDPNAYRWTAKLSNNDYFYDDPDLRTRISFVLKTASGTDPVGHFEFHGHGTYAEALPDYLDAGRVYPGGAGELSYCGGCDPTVPAPPVAYVDVGSYIGTRLNTEFGLAAYMDGNVVAVPYYTGGDVYTDGTQSCLWTVSSLYATVQVQKVRWYGPSSPWGLVVNIWYTYPPDLEVGNISYTEEESNWCGGALSVSTLTLQSSSININGTISYPTLPSTITIDENPPTDPSPPTCNLKLYWPCDEGDNDTCFDYDASANDITSGSSVTWGLASRPYFAADQTIGDVTQVYSDLPVNNDDRSINMWVLLNTTASPDHAQIKMFWGSADEFSFTAVRYAATNVTSLIVGDGNYTIGQGIANPANDTWVMVTLTYNGTTGAGRMYWNGSLVKAFIWPDVLATSGNGLGIVADVNTAGTAQVGDVRVYDCALDQTTIDALYALGEPVDSPGVTCDSALTAASGTEYQYSMIASREYWFKGADDGDGSITVDVSGLTGTLNVYEGACGATSLLLAIVADGTYIIACTASAAIKLEFVPGAAIDVTFTLTY